MKDFLRFPHTPHLAWLGKNNPRNDKVLSSMEASNILANPIMLEEKLDGANLGISFSEAGEIQLQNRGSYLVPPYTGQFLKLKQWLNIHEDFLFDQLEDKCILFGEWCAAKHSLDYNYLPDWFLLFDVYDLQDQRFWSTSRRNQLADKIGLMCVPNIKQGIFDLTTLKQIVLTENSRFRQGRMEGLIIRSEDNDLLISRSKLVRPDFLQTIDNHWRGRLIEWNKLST